MSAVAQFLPNSIEHMFAAIKKTAAKIRDTVKQVKANKNQCARLSERVDIIIGFLQNDNSSKRSNKDLKKALERFENFLQRCLNFIKNFVKNGWFNRILQNNNYNQQFSQLNEELRKLWQDLNVGLAYSLYMVFAAEDAEDVKNDLEEIVEIVQTQQTLLSIRTQSNLSSKIQVNIPSIEIKNSTTHVQDQSNHHQDNSSLSAQYVLYPMKRISNRLHQKKLKST